MLNKVSSQSITEDTFSEIESLGVSSEFLDLIDAMLCEMPQERPDIDEVVNVIKEEYERYV